MRVEINSQTLGIPANIQFLAIRKQSSLQKHLTSRKNRRWKFKSISWCLCVWGGDVPCILVTANVYVTANEGSTWIGPTAYVT